MFLYALLLISECLPVVVNSFQESDCPAWHDTIDGECKCVAGLDAGSVSCDVDGHSVTVVIGHCMTWDNLTQSAIVNRCPLIGQLQVACSSANSYLSTVKINFSANISGPEINNMTCKQYNRQGTQCSQCIDGYGPATFSDGFTCADCNSQYSHLWFLNLLLQLSMVTLMYVVVVLFQIKGTSSPLNVIITYAQLFVCAFTISVGVRVRMICILGPTLTTIL